MESGDLRTAQSSSEPGAETTFYCCRGQSRGVRTVDDLQTSSSPRDSTSRPSLLIVGLCNGMLGERLR